MAKATKKAHDISSAIKCIDCRNAREPRGNPIVIRCPVLGRMLVGNAKRKCNYYEK